MLLCLHTHCTLPILLKYKYCTQLLLHITLYILYPLFLSIMKTFFSLKHFTEVDISSSLFKLLRFCYCIISVFSLLESISCGKPLRGLGAVYSWFTVHRGSKAIAAKVYSICLRRLYSIGVIWTEKYLYICLLRFKHI